MSLYLYLNELSHVDTWVNGGSVPIKPASTYRSLERGGILTPDENLIHKSAVDLLSIPFMRFNPKATVKGLSFIGMTVNGKPVPDIIDAALYEEDGLILSFSYRVTKLVAKKMNKKACVKILDIEALKQAIDSQIGVVSEAKSCQYTNGHQRNHFLKSELDYWQAEYRMFWPVNTAVQVDIPPGTAELICTW